MKFMNGVLAAAMALGALTAHADGLQNDLGVLDSGAGLSFSSLSDADQASNFFHLYHFELGASGSIVGSFANLVGATLDRVKLAGNGNFLWSTLDKDLSFSYDNVAEGYYALYVFGSNTGGVSSYSGNMMAQPVPEPETYGMLLAGLGLIGAAVARRRKNG